VYKTTAYEFLRIKFGMEKLQKCDDAYDLYPKEDVYSELQVYDFKMFFQKPSQNHPMSLQES
jgi:hypothetical protein